MASASSKMALPESKRTECGSLLLLCLESRKVKGLGAMRFRDELRGGPGDVGCHFVLDNNVRIFYASYALNALRLLES